MRSCRSGCGVLAVLVTLGSADWTAAADRPNVIVIVADDLGFGDLGVNGCGDIPTPHIDALAASGVRCTNGYVSGPYCSPTRAGLMTGRYQQRFGHEFNPGPPTAENVEKGLTLKEQTLPQRLKDAGYQTGMVGKWHLGHAEHFQPPQRGFESFYGFWGGAHSYVKSGLGTDQPIVRGVEQIDEQEYLTDAFAREAKAFIANHKGQPFFLYLAFNAVHTPMEATDKYAARFKDIADPKRKTYAAMLSAMDDAIGAVAAQLKTQGAAENTLIFFISDNGGPETANASNNGPFRGQKAQTWEGGIHIPYFVSWPAKLNAGSTYDQPVIQLDILPTILAAAGAPASASDKLDGVDLLPYLTGAKTGAPHEALYWRFGPQVAIRMGDWKLVKGRDLTGPDAAGLERSTPGSIEGAQLFNLASDIGEQHDLSQTETARVKELAARWNAWNAELVEPTWGGPNRPNRRNRQAADAVE
jgi:arylsulfatase A-like enzyme